MKKFKLLLLTAVIFLFSFQKANGPIDLVNYKKSVIEYIDKLAQGVKIQDAKGAMLNYIQQNAAGAAFNHENGVIYITKSANPFSVTHEKLHSIESKKRGGGRCMSLDVMVAEEIVATELSLLNTIKAGFKKYPASFITKANIQRMLPAAEKQLAQATKMYIQHFKSFGAKGDLTTVRKRVEKLRAQYHWRYYDFNPSLSKKEGVFLKL